MVRRTDGRTYGRTDGRTDGLSKDGRTDERTDVRNDGQKETNYEREGWKERRITEWVKALYKAQIAFRTKA